MVREPGDFVFPDGELPEFGAAQVMGSMERN